MDETEVVYLCKRCLMPADSLGVCVYCGGEVIGCHPGDPNDPCRRPLMSEDGQIRTRAPLWWLRYTVARLMELMERTSG